MGKMRWKATELSAGLGVELINVSWGHIKNIHLHAIRFHIKNIHLRKTKTNTNPNRYRRRCPDPNARIQKKELQN